MTSVELIVRTAACTTALILAVTMFRARYAAPASRAFGAAFCLGVAVYLACSGSAPVCSADWWRPMLLLAIEVPFFFWGWTTSIMDDDFALRPVAIAGALLLLLVGVLGILTTSPEWNAVTVVLHSVLGIGFVVAALVNVLRGWRQDLVEARRRLRAVILVLSGSYSIVIMAVELVLHGQSPSADLLLLNAVLLAALLFGLACGVLDVSSSVRSAFGWTPPSRTSPVEPAEVLARDRDQELVARLQELMTHNAAYRDPGIGVASLATRLGVTEKKLREVINGRLEFKNFSAYVNAFRLEEVRRRLLDPRHDAAPILTMALEAGFGSIVAFNRAFKGKYGVTPTVYRTQRHAELALTNNDKLPGESGAVDTPSQHPHEPSSLHGAAARGLQHPHR
jgi:AraC-like DNA-binding protein